MNDIHPADHAKIFYRADANYSRHTYYAARKDTPNSVIVLYDENANQYWTYAESAHIIQIYSDDSLSYFSRKGKIGLIFAVNELPSIVKHLIEQGYRVTIVGRNARQVAKKCKEICGIK